MSNVSVGSNRQSNVWVAAIDIKCYSTATQKRKKKHPAVIFLHQLYSNILAQTLNIHYSFVEF